MVIIPKFGQSGQVHSENTIRGKRLALGLTQQQVADKAGILLQHYQKFETGERELTNSTFITACKVIEALSMDVTAFYHGEYALFPSDENALTVRSEKKQSHDDELDIPETPITRLFFVPNLNATPQQKIEISISQGDVSLNSMSSFCFSANLSMEELAKTHGFPNSKPFTQEESRSWIKALNKTDILSWKRRYLPEQRLLPQSFSDNPKVQYIPSVVDPFEEAAAVADGISLNWMLEIDRSDRKRTKYISGYGVYPVGFDSFLALLSLVAPDFRWRTADRI